MTAGHILHWQIGPVQGFISQARRTRDYWAGSFLLSYLAGVAMRELQEKNSGRVVVPADLASDPLYRALTGTHKKPEDVVVGTLVNRFQAVLDDPDKFVPPRGQVDPCTTAVKRKWREIADAVWETFVKPAKVKLIDGSMIDAIDIGADLRRARLPRRIWDEQVDSFFETSWVLGQEPASGEPDDGAWLDRRKNWRVHARKPEPGDHCMIMGEWQELSGHVRSSELGRKAQDGFWDALQAQVSRVVNPELGNDNRDYELLELGRTERLCAIALIKRLFPILPESTLEAVIGWLPDGPKRERSNPTKPGRIRYWPSTAYMAAVPWMIRAWTSTGADGKEACRLFGHRAENDDHVEAVAERESRIRTLAGGDPAIGREIRCIGTLGGEFFYEDMLETEIGNAERESRFARSALADAATTPTERVLATQRKERAERRLARKRPALDDLRRLLTALRPLWGTAAGGALSARQRKFDTAAPFYGLLLMDGDRGGELMNRDKLGPELVSAAFGRFQRMVPRIVRRMDGVLIYAGADDVKALLPIDRALYCVQCLHAAYLRAFGAKYFSGRDDELRKLREHKPTISAGLVLAHYHLPLSAVIREAHRLLDEVAKDGNGRNSLATAFWKPSGKAAEWVSGFARFEAGRETEDGPIAHLTPLAEAYARDPERSSSFLYNVEDRYRDVFAPREGDALFEADDPRLEQLLRAEWLKGRNTGRMSETELREEQARVAEMLAVCRTLDHKSGGRRCNLDGALIAKFLADNGVGADQPARSDGENAA